jgi:hypothetical protein
MQGEKTSIEVVHHCSLDSPVVSIRSKPVVVPVGGELQPIIPGQCHHTRVVETNQVIQYLID